MKKGLTVFIILSVFFSVCGQNLYADPLNKNKISLIVKSSPDSPFQTELVIKANQLHEQISKKGMRKKTEVFPVTDTYLTREEDSSIRIFSVDQWANLFDEQQDETIELPDTVKGKLLNYVEQLRAQHYGKMMSWDKAEHIIAKKTKFKVIDLDTGLHFNVQRRAGKNHADVQPLTKEDTAVMKQIYQGKWSWKRKAILVQKNHQILAASMHGMPHGGDGIPGNGFAGHFCIHFLGSATHGSGSMDPEHQIMVYKAAGKLNEYLQHASPYEIINSFFMALYLQEPQFLKMTFTHGRHPQLDYFISDMPNIRGIRKTSYDEKEILDLISLEIPIEVSIYRSGQKEEKTTFTFRMRRDSLTSPWKIDFITQIS